MTKAQGARPVSAEHVSEFLSALPLAQEAKQLHSSFRAWGKGGREPAPALSPTPGSPATFPRSADSGWIFLEVSLSCGPWPAGAGAQARADLSLGSFQKGSNTITSPVLSPAAVPAPASALPKTTRTTTGSPAPCWALEGTGGQQRQSVCPAPQLPHDMSRNAAHAIPQENTSKHDTAQHFCKGSEPAARRDRPLGWTQRPSLPSLSSVEHLGDQT